MANDLFNINDEITIQHLKSLYYQELKSSYKFQGESHDFWEIIYVDKGIIHTLIDNNTFLLAQGEALIIEPSVFHNLWVENKKTANIINLSFTIKKGNLHKFSNRIIQFNQLEKDILKNIITESNTTFNSFKDLVWIQDLWNPEDMNTSKLFGSEHLIKNYLEILLIHIGRKFVNIDISSTTISPKKTDKDIVESILKYMNDNVSSTLTIKSISSEFHICETTLKQIFKRNFNMGVMEYFRNLKIEQAKKYIREEEMNITEISTVLGYSSVHHFSNQFSKIVNMTPREYSNLITSSLCVELIPEICRQ